MRTLRFFLCVFIVVLVTIISSDVIVKSQLVDVYIPSLEEINTKAKYLTPNLDTTNNAIYNSNALVDELRLLGLEGQFLINKREAANIAAYGGILWRTRLNIFIKTVATGSYLDALESFIENDLLTKAGKIDREQEYALACQAVNSHYRPTVSGGTEPSFHPYISLLPCVWNT